MSKLLPAVAFASVFSTLAQASPPEEGSKQMVRMFDFVAFITTMHNKAGGSCCNLGDGRMGDGGDELKEERKFGEDGQMHYRVFVTREIFGRDSHNPENKLPVNTEYENLIPPEGKWFDVPVEAVLTSDLPDIQKCFKVTTGKCPAPPDNILWLSTGGTVYCYWPIQQWTLNKVPRFAKLTP